MTITARRRPPATDVIVVDNTIATGASITATAHALTAIGIHVTSILAITSALIEIR